MTASLDQFRSEYDEQSLGMLSDILSTLYQNPERSVLREYIANGIDAHRISGYSGPVEVTLPRESHPTLVIRDHGDGLSREDMQKVYFSYVRSTKREDDTQIGALGLGAKSAFALTKSWTVTNIHRGLKYIVASVNDDYGAPQQTVLVNGAPTDEHSGITVTIPVSERHLSHRWTETAMSLALWLPKGSVVINGDEPARHWETDAYVYGNTVRAKDSTYGFREYNVFQAIMGGIGYVVDDLTKETVKREAAALLDGEDFDTAQVRSAMAVYPKAALSTMGSGSRYGSKDADTPAEAAVKDLARIGYAHESLRTALLDAAMSRPLLVGLGDVDFMPSRESVKGTPRTISALAAAVAHTVHTLTSEITTTRTKSAETRVEAAHKIADASHLTMREVLVALAIHDTDTKVYSIGAEGRAIGTHALITGSHAKRTLVTGVSGTKLYKGRMYSRARSTSVLVTDDTSLVDPHIGNIGGYFRSTDGNSGVMTHDEFKARVAAEFPSQRGSTDTRHPLVITDGEGGVSRDQVPFSELEDFLDGVDCVYVGDELPYHGALTEASDLGKRVAVVLRGRRKFETFVKELGEDVVAPTSKLAVDLSLFLATESKSLVAGASAFDKAAVSLAMSEHAKRVTENLIVLFDSSVGDLIADTHRARTFASTYVAGAELLTTTEGNRLRRAMLRVSDLSSCDADAAALVVIHDCDPWPLLGTGVAGTSRAMTHAAAYLAAVG